MGYCWKGTAQASTIFLAFERFMVNGNYKDFGIG